MIVSGPTIAVSPQARQSYLALFSLKRRCIACTSRHSSSGQFRRSDFSGQGFTGYYETGSPTVGPLADAYGAPRITPKVLKQHLDNYVIGQERAKKVLSVAVYNHYQRVQELERREEEEDEMLAQQARREFVRHPVEDEFPGQQPTVNIFSSPPTSPSPNPSYVPLDVPEQHVTTIEKSNILLLGPSGVGKTLMAKTLARVLEVPFSMSDCTPFTQAGYIGEDVEVCVQRLLAAANYDVTRAERGIICLDEIDKIATAKVSHGKDVSGEGVQQALLKIIEGTTIQVQAKQERGSGHPPGSNSPAGRSPNAVPTSGFPNSSSPLGGSSGNYPAPPGKGETYNVNTDNILFIFTGAFVGLHKTVMDRLAKGSIGFGARVHSASGLSSSASADSNDPTIRSSGADIDDLFRKNLPFYSAPPATSSPASSHAKSNSEPTTYNTLDLTEPADLQKFGLIPELIGRIPITCALSSLSTAALVRVLTEPRNALLAQYTQLFALSGIELHFSTAALHEVAKAASGMGTGARGLRTVMERLLGESMFEVPGSGMRYVAVTGKAARKEEAVKVFARQEIAELQQILKDEEDEWEWRQGGGKGVWRREGHSEVGSFEEYRERVRVAGTG